MAAYFLRSIWLNDMSFSPPGILFPMFYKIENSSSQREGGQTFTKGRHDKAKRWPLIIRRWWPHSHLWWHLQIQRLDGSIWWWRKKFFRYFLRAFHLLPSSFSAIIFLRAESRVQPCSLCAQCHLKTWSGTVRCLVEDGKGILMSFSLEFQPNPRKNRDRN